MKVPKILFGTGGEVHRPVGSWMRKVKKNRQWPPLADEDYIDTEEVAPLGSSVRIIFDIDPGIGAQKHLRAYAPARYFKWTLGTGELRGERNIFFDGLVESTWGLLCLLPQQSYIPTPEMDRGRCLRFFERLVEDWDLILAEKHLFEKDTMGGFWPKYFWKGGNTRLFPRMWNAGVPAELINNTELKDTDDYQAIRWIEEYIL